MLKSSGYCVFLISFLVAGGCCYFSAALEAPVKPSSNTRPKSMTNSTTVARLQKGSDGHHSSCGNSADLARRVSTCSKPLIDMLYGRIEKWPRTEEDALKLCDSFAVSEHCLRDTSRKCGVGISKTVISTLANSVGKVRKRECSKAKAAAIVKTTMCLENNQNLVYNWMSNVTDRLTTIEMQFPSDAKMNAICCTVNDIERELRIIIEPLCLDEGRLMGRLFRTVLEDVIELICRNSKCNNYLKGYKISKAADSDNIIILIVRIIFSLID